MTLGQGVDLPREEQAMVLQDREKEQALVVQEREKEQAIVLQSREMEQSMVLQNREMGQTLLHEYREMKPEDWQQNQGTAEVTSIRVSVIKTTKRANPEEECRSNRIENLRHIFIWKINVNYTHYIISDLTNHKLCYRNEDFRSQF